MFLVESEQCMLLPLSLSGMFFMRLFRQLILWLIALTLVGFVIISWVLKICLLVCLVSFIWMCTRSLTLGDSFSFLLLFVSLLFLDVLSYFSWTRKFCYMFPSIYLCQPPIYMYIYIISNTRLAEKSLGIVLFWKVQ